MPHPPQPPFFFHLRTAGDQLVVDDMGTAATSVRDAYAYALMLIRDIRTGLPEEANAGMTVEVADGRGEIVLVVPFADGEGTLH